MGNLGGGEILIILLVALIVLGPAKLPDAARQVGKAVAEIRKVSSGFQREIKAAMESEDDSPPPAAQVPSGLPEGQAASPTAGNPADAVAPVDAGPAEPSIERPTA